MALQVAAISSPPSVSFEVFPPRSPAAETRLADCITRLAPLAPNFVSVTCGAGGSAKSETEETVYWLRYDAGVTTAAHLTCVGISRDQVRRLAEKYWRAGVRQIVALRGDPPKDDRARIDGYRSAAELVAGLKRIAGFEIAVAGYPEVHPRAVGEAADLDNLKRKIDAGADRIITQYAFEAAPYLRFLERVRAAGIAVPVSAGIMPIVDFAQIVRFSGSCGASVPDWLGRRFEGLDDDITTGRLIAATVAVRLCEELRHFGVDDFHFYTLNRPELTYAICHELGLRPRPTHPVGLRNTATP